MKTPECIFSDAHVLQCELASEVLRTSGSLRLGVSGWSMLPALWPGDTLMIERADAEAVQPGDIVLFARNRRFFVHRVIAKNQRDEKIQTRGDAMPNMDPPVSNPELLGRVVSVMRNGRTLEPRRERSAASRSVGVLLQHSQTATRITVAMRQLVEGS